MTGPSVGPVRGCPFVLCAAQVMLVLEQATPGDDETILKRVPQHRIEGEAERFGQCPASLMVIPLDDYSRQALETQADAMRPMLVPPQPSPPGEAKPYGGIFPVGRGPHPLTPRPDPNHEFQRLGYQGGPKRPTAGPNVPQHGKAGQSVVPLPDGPHAGPGPGRASKPYQPTGGDVDFVVPPPVAVPNPTDQPQQGSSTDMSDNDLRSQLIALTRLAIEGFGQEQEGAAALTACLDQTFSAILKALEEKQKATHAIALAAVGSRTDIPPSAANMIGASASIESCIGAVVRAQADVQLWVDSVHGYAGRATHHAREYLAVI